MREMSIFFYHEGGTSQSQGTPNNLRIILRILLTRNLTQNLNVTFEDAHWRG